MLHVFCKGQFQFSLAEWKGAVISNNSFIYSVKHNAWCHYVVGRKHWIPDEEVPKSYIAAVLILV